jgi:hypothetical protein
MERNINKYFLKYLMEYGILESLFDKKVLQILRLFMKNRDKKFYLMEIAKASNVPIATTSRIMHKLIDLKLIDIVAVSKFKLYVLAQNETTSFLEGILKESKKILDYFIDETRKIPGIEAVILHGEESEERANILIIAESVDPNIIRNICGVIKEKYNFTVSTLTLTKEQFVQMTSMGLYSGKKRMLYKSPLFI